MVTSEQIRDMFDLRNVSISGDEIICSCPFSDNHVHGDRNPSFGISMSKGVAHCFSCGWSGNLVQMARDLLGMTYGQAYEYVYSNITVDDMLQMTNRNTGSHFKTFDGGYTGEYMYSQEPHIYWRERGFNEQTIGKWQLGYDPSSNRVVVPIYQHGTLVGWSKRAVDNVTKLSGCIHLACRRT